MISMGISTTALANNIYVGGGIIGAKTSDQGFDQKPSFNVVTATIGNQFNQYFAAEARVGLGVGSQKAKLNGVEGKVKIESKYGVYLKAGVPIGNTFYPYAIVGQSSVKQKGLAKVKESGTSFGLGTNIRFNRFTVNIEYQNYIDKETYDLEGFSVGFTKRF